MPKIPPLNSNDLATRAQTTTQVASDLELPGTSNHGLAQTDLRSSPKLGTPGASEPAVPQLNQLILHKLLKLPHELKQLGELVFSKNNSVESSKALWNLFAAKPGQQTNSSQLHQLQHKPNADDLKGSITAKSKDGKTAHSNVRNLNAHSIFINDGVNTNIININTHADLNSGSLTALEFTDDGYLCAADSKNNVFVFRDQESSDHISYHEIQNPIVSMSGSNKHVLICDKNTALLSQVWDASVATLHVPQDFEITTASMAKNGLIALGSKSGQVALYEQASDGSKPMLLGEISVAPLKLNQVIHLDICPQTNRLLAATQSGQVVTFDLNSLRPEPQSNKSKLNSSAVSTASTSSEVFYKCLAKLVSWKADEVNGLGIRGDLQRFIPFLQPNEAVLLTDFIEKFDRLIDPKAQASTKASAQFEVALQNLAANYNASRVLIKSMLNFDFIYHDHTKLNFNEIHDLLNILTPNENNFNAAANAINQHVKGAFNIVGSGNTIIGRLLAANREGLISDGNNTAQNLQTANGAPVAAINQNGLAQGRNHNDRVRKELRVPIGELITRSFVADPIVALNNEGIEHTLSIMADHWHNTLERGSFSHQRMEQLDPIDVLRRQLPATILALASNRGPNTIDKTMVSAYVKKLQRFSLNANTNSIGTTQQLIKDLKNNLVPQLCAGLGQRAKILHTWLDNIAATLPLLLTQTEQIKARLQTQESGITAGRAILNQLPFIDTPKSADFHKFLLGQTDTLDLGNKGQDTQICFERAKSKLTPQDKTTYESLREEAKTNKSIKNSRVLRHRVVMLEQMMRREYDHCFVDNQLLKQSCGEQIKTYATAPVGETCILMRKDQQGRDTLKRMLIQNSAQEQGQTTLTLAALNHVGLPNEVSEAILLGQVDQKVFTDNALEQDIIAAQKLFMDIEVDYGDRFSLNAFMDQDQLRQSLLSLCLVAQLQSNNLDQAKLLQLVDIQNQAQALNFTDAAGPSQSAADRSAVILGGGPTGLLTALLANPEYLKANGKVTLYERRDIDNPNKEPFERSQIVRLDPRWIASLRYLTGTAFEDTFIPLAGHTQSFLANNIPDQGFIETTIKTLEKTMFRTLQQHQEAGLVDLVCGQGATLNPEQTKLKVGNDERLLDKTDIIDCSGKSKSSKDVLQVTSAEHYAVCCFSGAKVSVIAHKQGDARYASPISRAVRTTFGDDPFRLVGDFTKALHVEKLFKAIVQAANSQNARLEFKSLFPQAPNPNGHASEASEDSAADQKVAEILKSLTALAESSGKFERAYNQARVFEDGDVYYIGTEVNREFAQWKDETAQSLFTDQSDAASKSQVAFHKICDRLWFSGFQAKLNDANVLNPSAKLPQFHPFDSHESMPIKQLKLGDAFKFAGNRYEFIEATANTQAGSAFLCRDMTGALKKFVGHESVQRASDLARDRGGEQESKVALASFPVAHQIAHSALDTSSEDRFFNAKLGDAQASPHFMRYSGLTGGCINAHAIVRLLPGMKQEAAAQRAQAAVDYRRHTDWSNWEVVVRGTAAGYGDGFLHPSMSYKDFVGYAANKIIACESNEHTRGQVNLDELFPNFWVKTFADALIPRGVEKNIDFARGYAQGIQSAMRLSTNDIDDPSIKASVLKHCKSLTSRIWDYAVGASETGSRVPTPINHQPLALDLNVLTSGFQGQGAIEATTNATAMASAVNAVKGLAEQETGASAGNIGDGLVLPFGLFTLRRTFTGFVNAQQYKRSLEAIQHNYFLAHGPDTFTKLFQLLSEAGEQTNNANPKFVDLKAQANALVEACEHYAQLLAPKATDLLESINEIGEKTGVDSLAELKTLQVDISKKLIAQEFNGQPYVQTRAVTLLQAIKEFTQVSTPAEALLTQSATREARLALKSFEQWQTLAADHIETNPVAFGTYSKRRLANGGIIRTIQGALETAMGPGLEKLLTIEQRLKLYERCSFSLYSSALLHQLGALQEHLKDSGFSTDLTTDIHQLAQFVKARFESDVASATSVSAIGTAAATGLNVANSITQLSMGMGDFLMPLSNAAGGASIAPAVIIGLLNARTLGHDFRHLKGLNHHMREQLDLNEAEQQALKATQQLLSERVAASALRLVASGSAVAAGATALGGATLPVSAGLSATSLVSALLATCVGLHAKYRVLYKMDHEFLIHLCDAYKPRLEELHAKFIASASALDTRKQTTAWRNTAAQFIEETGFHRALGTDANRVQIIKTYIESGLNKDAVEKMKQAVSWQVSAQLGDVFSTIVPADPDNLTPGEIYRVNSKKDGIQNLRLILSKKKDLEFLDPLNSQKFIIPKINTKVHKVVEGASSVLMESRVSGEQYLVMKSGRVCQNVRFQT